LMPMVTLFRPENSTVDYPAAKESAQICGRTPFEMAAFTARRLAVDALLIRITTDLNVPDGPRYEELGVNLRGMATTVLQGYIDPQMSEIKGGFAELRQRLAARIADLVDRELPARAAATPNATGLLARIGKRKAPEKSAEAAEITALTKWKAVLTQEDDPFARACYRALLAIIGGMVNQRGRLVVPRDEIIELATNWAANDYGSYWIGERIQPMIFAAAKAE